MTFEYLQQRRLYNISWQPVPVLSHPHSKVISHIQRELLMFQLVPVAFCPFAGHHWEESGPFILVPSFQTLTHVDQILPEPSPS